MFADEEAQATATESACRGGIHLAERLKETVNFVFRNANTCVGNRERDVDFACGQVHSAQDRDFDAPHARELDSVANDVPEYLTGARDIAADGERQLRIDGQFDCESFFRSARSKELCGVLDAFAQIKRAVFDLDSSRFDLRHI